MMGYLSAKEIADKWGVTARRVTGLCAEGKIAGAKQDGKFWMIPEDAIKPDDCRHILVRDAGIADERQSVEKKRLPVGISDYVRAQSEYYYVDKTLMIRDFLDRKPLVSLFTRPRRFGKTINMDMLRVFFEKSEENTSRYFVDKEIWKCGERYRSYQGKYPVIFLSFKDVKYDSWEMTLDRIRVLLQEEYGRHRIILESGKIADYEKDYFGRILEGSASEVELSVSLERLSKMLSAYNEKAPVIIIDEYDTPIQEGYSKGFYDEIIGFMRNLFSGAFKDNRYVSYGFMTGILRISQESIFSGLNNLTVDTVMDDEYSRYFGFTGEEVRRILRYYEVENKEKELRDWYDGYMFGSEEIFNPWSVINYISNNCLPQTYWANTGKNEILEDVVKKADADTNEKLSALLQNETVIARIDQSVTYRALSGEPGSVFGLLVAAGYLKVEKKEFMTDGSYLCEVSVPNREIAAVYKMEILSHLVREGAVSGTSVNAVAEALHTRDWEKLKKALTDFMRNTISFYDGGTEGFYHGMVHGLLGLMESQYRIRSNRESGYGRYDICMFPKEKRYPGIIMEIKYESGIDGEKLKALAEDARKQIDDKEYENELNECGVEEILKLGIAFSGKKAEVKA